MISKVEDGIVQLIHMPGSEMPADMLTKPLAKEPFEKHRKRIFNVANSTCLTTPIISSIITTSSFSQNIVIPPILKSILKSVHLSYIRPTFIVTPEMLPTRKRHKPFPRSNMFHTKEFHYDDPPIYINKYLA